MEVLSPVHSMQIHAFLDNMLVSVYLMKFHDFQEQTPQISFSDRTLLVAAQKIILMTESFALFRLCYDGNCDLVVHYTLWIYPSHNITESKRPITLMKVGFHCKVLLAYAFWNQIFSSFSRPLKSLSNCREIFFIFPQPLSVAYPLLIT